MTFFTFASHIFRGGLTMPLSLKPHFSGRMCFTRLILILCIGVGVLTPHEASPFGYAFGDFLTTGKGLGFGLASSDSARRDTEYNNRKNQLARLEEEYGQFQAQAVSEKKRIDDALASLDGKIDSRDFIREEILSRAHTMKTNRQLYDTIDKLIAQRIEQIKRFIGAIKNDIDEATEREKNGKSDDKYKKRHTWQDFKSEQNLLDQMVTQQTKIENELKIATSELDTERDRQMQHERSSRQVESTLNAEIGHTVSPDEKERLEAKLDAISKRYSSEKTKIALQITSAEQRIRQLEDEIAFSNYEREKKRDYVQYIKDHLVFVVGDIEKATQELTETKNRALAAFKEIDVQLRALRAEKQKWEKAKQEHDALGLTNEVAFAQNEKIVRNILLAEEQIYLCEYKRKHQEIGVREKEWQRLIIEKMYELRNDEQGQVAERNLEIWINQFASQEAVIGTLQSELKNALKSLDIRRDDINSDKSAITARASTVRSSEAQKIYQEVSRIITQRHQVHQELYDAIVGVKSVADRLEEDVRKMNEALGEVRGSLNIWQRSKVALSRKNLIQAWNDVRGFSRYMMKSTVQFVVPPYNFDALMNNEWTLALWLILYALCGFFFVRLFTRGMGAAGSYFERLLYIYQGQMLAIYITVVRSIVRFVAYYSRGIGAWLYMRFLLMLVYVPFFERLKETARLREFPGSLYFASLFYVVTIPFLVYLAYQFMREIKKINQRMSFLFFTEKLEEKLLFLLSIILYTSATLLPLKKALSYYLSYTAHAPDSRIISVINGGWTLVISVAFLFFFGKEDIIKLIPTHVRVGQVLGYIVDTYYYPVFIFFIGFFILMNPYVGYHNLAWYLAASIPLSVGALYLLLKLHSSVHKYIFSLFMKDDETEENEVSDRVENAKLYYGFSIIVLFLAVAALAFVVITKIWRIDYTLGQLWYSISQEWVIRLGDSGDYIGFGGIVTLLLFILGGSIVSSLFSRFVLPRLFAVFRTEYGAQNTVSRILHYIIICLALFLGLYAIKLTQFVNNLALALLVGITFGLRDLIADFSAGIWILLERPIEPGNFIETGDLRGTVKKIAIRATTIKTARNYTVVVPNRELVAKPIINWGAGYYGVGFEFTIMLPYKADPLEMRQMILDIVNQHKLVLRMPPAVVRCENFEESGVLFFVRAFISTRRVRDQWDIASDIRIALLVELKNRGIKVPYPHRVVIPVDGYHPLGGHTHTPMP